MAGYFRRAHFPASPLVVAGLFSMKRLLKIVISTPLKSILRMLRPVRKNLRRLQAHASLAADITTSLPSSAVIEGKVDVYGTRNIHIGEDVLFFPDIHLETREDASIRIADGVVLSRGVHIVAFAGVTVGRGS